MRAEISYDLVMNVDMEFVEGTYRLPNAGWQVLIASKRDIHEVELVQQVWESGATGVLLRFPASKQLNAEAIERVLSVSFGVSDWVQVHGPDSMQLR
jgi:hypothetical protein